MIARIAADAPDPPVMATRSEEVRAGRTVPAAGIALVISASVVDDAIVLGVPEHFLVSTLPSRSER